MRPFVYLSLLLALVIPLAVSGSASARGDHASGPSSSQIQQLFANGIRSLSGSGNNLRHPAWGQAGTQYLRTAPANYGDGKSTMISGPDPRYVSNRIFNDTGQNIFSENGVTQWGWTWGQFLDHTLGLAQNGGASAPLAFNASDPLESFVNDFGAIGFSRDAAAPGTGVTSPEQQINTVNSYIDAWAVYGGAEDRLEWLREGPVDGNMSNNGAHLLETDDGYLPRATARGDASTAPVMALMGQLMGEPDQRVVAGDVRANENIALTAVQTLFVREHNRIVDALPASLTAELKFQIARAVVIAEEQYITYNEFLPSLGVKLDKYRGDNPFVNSSISNEFATVAYRAHSMIHGEFDMEAAAGQYTPGQIEAFEAAGIQFEPDGDNMQMEVPLSVAFGNPDLVPELGLDVILASLSNQSQYKNDEQIDNALRSVLFQVPGPGVTDPSECLNDQDLPACFSGVADLGAIDLARDRDHGIASYNALRKAYGLAPKRSFTAITGESTDAFPSDPEIDAGDPINDPDILDFVQLRDAHGNVLPPGDEEAATVGVRRTTLAARLKAVYGSVDKVDAFVGMTSEKHVPGTEFGQLQLAIWKKQFTALRDGDRFFYGNYGALDWVQKLFGISYHHSLSDIIAMNTDVEPGDLHINAFRLASPPYTGGSGSHHHTTSAAVDDNNAVLESTGAAFSARRLRESAAL